MTTKANALTSAALTTLCGCALFLAAVAPAMPGATASQQAAAQVTAAASVRA